jgi:hypothetical protein
VRREGSGGRRVACVVALACATSTVAAAEPPWSVVALTAQGALLVLRTDAPADVRRVAGSALPADLVGIDVRPADGRLYGLTAGNDLYRIDPTTGAAEVVSTLTIPFDGGARSGIDFNPQVDRLRLVSASGQDLRVNVALGAAAVDGALAYAADDRNAGTRPHVTAAAYTSNVAATPTTRLIEIDAAADVLVAQDPPNDGVLRTIGQLDVDAGDAAGLDVVTTDGVDHALAGLGHVLYAVDLASGHAPPLGTVGDGAADVVSLAILPRPGGR